MSRNVRLLLIAAIVVMSFTSALFAQNAAVIGNVYDAKGAPMPGVVVLIENKSTGFTRVATTGADGSYTLPEVPPAEGYSVTATTSDGAEIDHTKQLISVNVGDEHEILPALRQPLAPGVAGVEPSAAGPAAANAKPIAVNNTKVPNDKQTSIAGVITSEQLRTLPLYNRNFLALGLLSPNTHDVEAGSPLSGASFSIAGQRPSSNNFLLDGAENIASNNNQAIPFQVNDAIQEFRVTSSTANAEFGRGAGGVVSVLTKSGTNKMHGAIFGYFANDALNQDSPLSIYKGTGFDRAASLAGSTTSTALTIPAGGSVAPSTYNQYVATAQANGFSTSPAGQPIPTGACNASNANGTFDPAGVLSKCGDSFKQQFDSKQFGANLGGAPIPNRLFLFGSYEGTRINNPNSVFERVPTAFDKNAPINNAAHTADYQLAKNILGIFPTSNVVAVPGVLEFYQGSAPNFTNVHNALIRSDFKKSDSMNFSLRYAGQLLDQLHDDTLPVSSAYAGNGADRKAQNQNGVLTFTKNYKKLINELRVGVTQFRLVESPQDASFNAKNLGLQNAALQTILLGGLDTRYSGAAPNVEGAFGGWQDSFWSTSNAAGTPSAQAIMEPSLDGAFPFARLGAPLDAPSLHRDTTWLLSDGLNWSLGKHSFKFGGDFRYIQNRVTDGGFSRGYIASGNIGEFTSDSETCNRGTLAGTPDCVGNAFRAPSFDYALNQQPNFNGLFNSASYSGYMQDSWKMTRKVTVNVGGRYEFFGVPKEVNDQIWNFDPTANGLVQQGGTNVFDPYGYSCGAAAKFIDSLPRDRSSLSPTQWQCASSSAGNIIQPDLNDFAGRAGIAWDVRGNGRTVVRAGAGIFYDQSPISYMARLMENRPTQYNATSPRYIYGQTFAGTFVPTGAATACPQCGFGNSTVDPTNANFVPISQSAASPFGLAGRDNRNSKTPYTRQVNVTVQQNVTDNLSLELGYIGAGGHRLPIITNRGYNNEWFCTSSRAPLAAPVGATVPVCDPFSYFPVEMQANVGSSLYNSALARVRVAQFHGLRVNATYTYSRSTDNASSANPNLIPTPLLTQAFGLQQFGLGNPFGFALAGGGAAGAGGLTTIGGVTINVRNVVPGSVPLTSFAAADTFTSSLTTTGAGQIFVSRYNLPQDPNTFNVNDLGRSDFDTTHRVVVDYNYELPLFRNSEKLGGWQVSGIVTVQSGQPFTIFSGPLFGEVTQRVNASNVQLTGNPNNDISGLITLPGASPDVNPLAAQPGQPATIPCAFASANGSPLFSGTQGSPCTGNTFRNQFTGPAFASTDLAIQKTFKMFGEGKDLSLRTEVFNLLNRANYYNPISVFSLDGISNLNPDFGQVKSAHQPLQLQFSARFTF